MPIKTLTTPHLGINTYLFWDEKSKKAIVIDPTRHIEPLLQAIKTCGCTVTHILETHVHADFVSGAKELKKQLKNSPLICSSKMGGKRWLPEYADIPVKDRSSILLGNNVIEAWHTPGHTPEHVIWVVKEGKEPVAAFTGDLLFVGSVGRPDLLGKGQLAKLTEKLYKSLFETLSELPDSLLIFPGHGAGSFCGSSISSKSTSTLGEERKNNPYLKKRGYAAWIQLLNKNLPRTPAYFPLMKAINVRGAPLRHDLPKLKKLKKGTGFLLDIRPIEEFAQGHPTGAIHISLDGSFLHWAPEIVPYDQPITLIANDKTTAEKAVAQLQMVGIDAIAGYMLPTSEVRTSLIDQKELKKNIKKYFILDVRTQDEWKAIHIDTAKHIELYDLNNKLKELPKNKPIVTVCGSGYRASIAASLLQKQGFDDVQNLRGGMRSWKGA